MTDGGLLSEGSRQVSRPRYRRRGPRAPPTRVSGCLASTRLLASRGLGSPCSWAAVSARGGQVCFLQTTQGRVRLLPVPLRERAVRRLGLVCHLSCHRLRAQQPGHFCICTFPSRFLPSRRLRPGQAWETTAVLSTRGRRRTGPGAVPAGPVASCLAPAPPFPSRSSVPGNRCGARKG